MASTSAQTRARQLVSHLDASSTPLSCQKLTATIGAEVSGIDLRRPITPQSAAAIDHALLAHKVIMFRNQRIGSKEQLALVQALNRHWGLEVSSPQQEFTYEQGAFVVRMLPSKADSLSTVWQVTSETAAHSARAEGGTAAPLNPAAASTRTAPAMARELSSFPFHCLLRRRNPSETKGRYFHTFGGSGNWVRTGHEHTKATNVWHADDNYVLQPPWVSTLNAQQLPAHGGDTVFADMGQAYADLADETQQLLCSQRVVADWDQVFPHYRALAYATGQAHEFTELRERYPRVKHPLVRTHPITGQRVLYANAIYTVGLEGMPEEDAAPLLRELYSLPGVPEYQCRLQWKSPGDFVLWDNRCVQHYAVADYGREHDTGRLMEHMATLGDRPFFQADDGTITYSDFVEHNESI